MAAKTEVPITPDYGIDAPLRFKGMIWRGVTLFLLGLGLYVMNRTDAPGGGLALFAVIGTIGLGYLAGAGVMFWSSRVAKLQYRDRILGAMPWRGDEKVLDVGCGRGLMLIGAAKRLKTGKAIGIDLWRKEDLSGNSGDSAMANAKAEGAADRVRVENGDMLRLPYQPNSYDTVVSSLAVHNLAGSTERGKAVLEMLRVLKPGGHLAVFDILHTDEYIRTAEQNGAQMVTRSSLSFLWCQPTRWFIVRKTS